MTSEWDEFEDEFGWPIGGTDSPRSRTPRLSMSRVESRARETERMRRTRQAKRDRGECQLCALKLAPDSASYCPQHRDERRDYMAALHEKRKAKQDAGAALARRMEQIKAAVQRHREGRGRG